MAGSKGSDPIDDLANVGVSRPATRVWATDPAQDHEIDDAGQPRKREKLTGADIEAKWAQGAQARSAGLKRATSPKVLRGVGAGLLALVTVGAIFVSGSESATFAVKNKANIASIKDLEGKIESIKIGPTAVKDDAKLKEYVDSATKVGAAIAASQNAYLTIGSGEQLADKRKAVAVELDAYLAEGNARNARVPWASMPKDSTGQKTYGWKFVTAMPAASGAVAQIDLLWLFTNTTNGELMSWSIGRYDGESQKVTKVDWGLTGNGVALVPYSNSGDVATNGQLGPSGSPSPSASASPTGSASPSTSATYGDVSPAGRPMQSPTPTPSTTASR